MNLLALVTDTLSSRGVPHALVGGLALAAHGLVRATMDADVLVVDATLAAEDFWEAVRRAGASCDVRRGEIGDPFHAVIRLSAPASYPVDVLVGRYAWQRDVISRARPTSFAGAEVPVVEAADLVLLKLFAGGPQDLLDAARIVAGPERQSLIAEIDSRIAALPIGCREQWERLRVS